MQRINRWAGGTAPLWCTKGKHMVERTGFAYKTNGSLMSWCKECKRVYDREGRIKREQNRLPTTRPVEPL